jgi:hypothetical protein
MNTEKQEGRTTGIKKEFFTGKELQALGLINETALRNQRLLARKGRIKDFIPWVKVGGAVKYNWESVEKYLEKHSYGSSNLN